MQADKKEPISIVYNKDCVQGMKKYPDKHFSLSAADLPYGINAQEERFKLFKSQLRLF